MTAAAVLLFFALVSGRQAPTPPACPPAQPVRELATHPGWPAAAPQDVASVRAIVQAFFSAISAPAGGKLARQRLDSLFVPGGRIAIPIVPAHSDDADVVFLTPDQYAGNSDKMTASGGFFDHMIALHSEHFGVIAQALASYQSSEDADGKKPIVRGVKSFELLNSRGRWYIVQVSWDRERPGNPIPDALLHNGIH